MLDATPVYGMKLVTLWDIGAVTAKMQVLMIITAKARVISEF